MVSSIGLMHSCNLARSTRRHRSLVRCLNLARSTPISRLARLSPDRAASELRSRGTRGPAFAAAIGEPGPGPRRRHAADARGAGPPLPDLRAPAPPPSCSISARSRARSRCTTGTGSSCSTAFSRVRGTPYTPFPLPRTTTALLTASRYGVRPFLQARGIDLPWGDRTTCRARPRSAVSATARTSFRRGAATGRCRGVRARRGAGLGARAQASVSRS
jgi:hypothetical protein